MENSSVTSTTSTNVSDQWSHKARSGSPPPTLEVGQSAIIQAGHNDMATQNDVLYGIGSQFSAIDDSTKNNDLHPNL